MQERFTDAAKFARALGAVEEGNFAPLLGDNIEQWWTFVRERIELGANELMIRVDLEDEDFGLYYLWILFGVQEHDAALSLESIVLPDFETDLKAALKVPVELEQVPYFTPS